MVTVAKSFEAPIKCKELTLCIHCLVAGRLLLVGLWCKFYLLL